MSTLHKVLIAAVAIIVVIFSAIFLFSQNRSVNVPNLSTTFSISSQTLSSSQSILSSTPLVISSSSQSASKTIESLKSSEKTISQVTQTICNQPDSPDLVKTEDGCFEIIWSAGDSDIFKNQEYVEAANKNLLFKSDSNIQLIKLIANDYFHKINKKFVSAKKTIIPLSIVKNNNSFEINFSMIDEDYIKINPNANLGVYLFRYSAIYVISQQPNGQWTFQFQDFIKDSNGKIINE